MKTPTFVLSAVLVSLLTVSQAGIVREAENEVMPYSIIDPIIKKILESMRPKLANLTLNDINEEVTTSGFRAVIRAKNIIVQNADTFVIKNLKSTAIPLRLTNLTLTWDRIQASASYDVVVDFNIPKFNSSIRVFGKGDARAVLSGTYLTIGANMEMKNGAVQIKPKGLFGFDASIRRAEVSLSSLMGRPELGKAVGDIVGKLLPEAVDALKEPFFNTFHDTIVNIINEVLKNYGSFHLDEELDLPELSSEDLDSIEEMDFSPDEPVDFGYEETEFESEV